MEKDEKFQDWLARQGIKWQFNLSRAPWWGGQFERLVGLLKQSLYKTIGNGNLQWKELQKVILDVEITLNNRPLGYMEDHVELPVLTPNSLLSGQPNILPEMDPSGIEDADLRKCAKSPVAKMVPRICQSTPKGTQHHPTNQGNEYKSRRSGACEIQRT